MALTVEDLLAGPRLPDKEVYIHALEDALIIAPVPLERYREYAKTDDQATQEELVQICIAESISKQSGMDLEAALELNKKVQMKITPAAWDEISEAVLITMFGESRLKKAQDVVGHG